jgi:hypothetical protein
MPAIRFGYQTQGNARFIRTVVDSLEEFDVFFGTDEWNEDPEYFRSVAPILNDGRPQALSYLDVAGAFTIFVASCFGKKIFDELYDRIAKAPFGAFFDRLLRQTQGEPVEIRQAIYLEDIDLIVIIRAVVSQKDVPTLSPLFLQGHRMAYTFIEANGRKAAVHCHSIEGGKISIEPELYLSLEHQMRGRKSLAKNDG